MSESCITFFNCLQQYTMNACNLWVRKRGKNSKFNSFYLKRYSSEMKTFMISKWLSNKLKFKRHCNFFICFKIHNVIHDNLMSVYRRTFAQQTQSTYTFAIRGIAAMWIIWYDVKLIWVSWTNHMNHLTTDYPKYKINTVEQQKMDERRPFLIG